MKKIFSYIKNHKLISLIVLVILAGGGYWAYQKWFVSTPTVKYNTAAATRGTLVTSISGTGQVSVTNQVDIKSKGSGDVYFVGVKNGQEVKAGTLLLSLNASDALKAVRDAQANLVSAQISLQKIQQPADALTLLQAQNSLAQAEETKQTAQDNIDKAYEDALNAISDTFLDLPGITAGMNNILFSYDISVSDKTVRTGIWNTDVLMMDIVNNNTETEKMQLFKTNAENDYRTARTKYDDNFTTYQASSRYSSTSTIETLLDQTLETVKSVAQAAKSESNYVDEYVDFRTQNNQSIYAKVKEYQTDLSSYIGQANSHLAALQNVASTFQSNKDTLADADRSIAEKTASLAKLQSGTDPLDIESQKLAVQQRQNALLDAREKLADYSVRAPFDGIVAKIDAKVGDSVTAGTSVGTLITNQQIATIALNEIDIAKIKVGQKATITFDAISDLNMTGEVIDVDTLGTVTQGVVSYNVKIAFDVQDDGIKPGMSASANIILASKPDVLMVPNSAVKTQGATSYVEELDNTGVPVKKTVQVGSSNDTMTEILSGLNEGEEVVTQKITVTSGSTANSAASAAGPGGAQNAFRALR